MSDTVSIMLLNQIVKNAISLHASKYDKKVRSLSEQEVNAKVYSMIIDHINEDSEPYEVTARDPREED